VVWGTLWYYVGGLSWAVSILLKLVASRNVWDLTRAGAIHERRWWYGGLERRDGAEIGHRKGHPVHARRPSAELIAKIRT
jgi:hypothetical protein